VATKAKLIESSPGDAFVEVDAPMPVGTLVRIITFGSDAPIDARVVDVVEQEAGAKSPPGMHILWGTAAEADAVTGDSGSSPPVDGSSEPVSGGDGRRRRRRHRGRS